MATVYLQCVKTKNFDEVMERYRRFIKNVDKIDTDPIRVYEPLIQMSLDALQITRDATEYLQNKKEEGFRKQREEDAQVAAESSKNETANVEETQQIHQ